MDKNVSVNNVKKKSRLFERIIFKFTETFHRFWDKAGKIVLPPPPKKGTFDQPK